MFCLPKTAWPPTSTAHWDAAVAIRAQTWRTVRRVYTAVDDSGPSGAPDGKIDRFIENEGVDETLSLHALKPDEPYYLGMFMTGAYQDIMGDMHNLFGRVNEIHVFVDDEDPEDFYIEEVIPGDTIEKVLSRVQYEPADLSRRVKSALDQKVKEGAIRPKEGVSLQDFYESVMRGYTYLGV